MKTMLKIFAVMMLASVYSCDPEDVMHPTDICSWTIVNHSGQNVGISLLYSIHTAPVGKYLEIDEASVLLDNCGARKKEDKFARLFAFGTNDAKMIIYDCNDSNNIFKTWNVNDDNASGRQFFDEECWTKKTRSDERYTYHDFTFELLPEDIAQ